MGALPRCRRSGACRLSGLALGSLATGSSAREQVPLIMTEGKGCYTFCHTATRRGVRFWRFGSYVLDAASPTK
jgi:hypothetical protein